MDAAGHKQVPEGVPNVALGPCDCHLKLGRGHPVLWQLSCDGGGDGSRAAVLVKDVDTGTEHSIGFRRRHAAGKKHLYVSTSGWSSEFVARRGLREGDEVGWRWDPVGRCLLFKVIKRAGDV